MSGQELRAALRQAELSQAAFGRVLGVATNTVNRWVQGELAVPRYAMAYLELLSRYRTARGNGGYFLPTVSG
jgi:DNA-binding transcriptional regulator YiaG